MDLDPGTIVTIQHYVTKFDMGRFLNPNLLGQLRLFRYNADETVFFEQSRIRYLYFQVEGQVRCAHYNSNGTLAVVGLTDPFTALGDVEILNEELSSTSVVTTEPAILLGLPMEAARSEGLKDPLFLHFLVEQLTGKLQDSTFLRLGHLLPVKSRLAVYILAQRPSGENGVVILPEKENLASMLGTSMRHLNRVFKDLIDKEIIGNGYPGVRIKNIVSLEKLID
jgi:CRP/FNR family putative post-exponential-phase nitrogen-starvation transcriptional regulator